jgi:hypothetical protein
MSTEQTQLLIDRYFDLMGRAADFAECFTPDVTWLVADTGEVIRGGDSVRDYIVGLHDTFEDSRTRRFLVGEDQVYLEGDCAAIPPEAGDRTHYCVAYDVQDDLISAMRCYGLGARHRGR